MYMRHIKQTLTLSLPMIVGQIGQMAMSVADNTMVGRVGADALTFWQNLAIYGIWYRLMISFTASALLMMLRFHIKTRTRPV